MANVFSDSADDGCVTKLIYDLTNSVSIGRKVTLVFKLNTTIRSLDFSYYWRIKSFHEKYRYYSAWIC